MVHKTSLGSSSGYRTYNKEKLDFSALRPAGSRDVHEMADMEIGDEEEMMEDELLNLVTQHASNSVKQFVDKRNEQNRLPQQPQQHMQIPQHHQV